MIYFISKYMHTCSCALQLLLNINANKPPTKYYSQLMQCMRLPLDPLEDWEMVSAVGPSVGRPAPDHEFVG